MGVDVRLQPSDGEDSRHALTQGLFQEVGAMENISINRFAMDSKKQACTAIAAIAKRFSATWETSSDSANAALTVAGKKVAVEIATLKRRGPGQAHEAKPHLRFDRVATRLMERLEATFSDTVPAGTTVLLTVTAPIRLPAKTAASLEEKIRTLVGRRSNGRYEKDTIHGNRVQIRVLRHKSERAPKLIGFVHNPDSDPLLLLNMAAELLTLRTAESAKPAAHRWLVVIGPRGICCLEAYRYIYAQLRMPTGFQKVLMVFGDGSVGILEG